MIHQDGTPDRPGSFHIDRGIIMAKKATKASKKTKKMGKSEMDHCGCNCNC